MILADSTGSLGMWVCLILAALLVVAGAVVFVRGDKDGKW